MMRFLAVVLSFSFFLSYVAAQEKSEKDKTKNLLHTPQALEQITKEEGMRQEFVEVSAESYPGLQLTVASPFEELTGYRPLKFKHLFAHPDLQFLSELRLQDAYGLTAPQPSGKLIDVSLPPDEEN